MAVAAEMCLIIESRNAARDTTTAPETDEEHNKCDNPGNCADLQLYMCRAGLSTTVARHNYWL